jgi:L-amino acid N-acyltransferase
MSTVRPVEIRLATPADLPAINDLYNHYVLHSTCTYQEQPDTMSDRRAWFDSHGPSHPVTVALLADEVVGWGSLSPYHKREAYRFTVENSVYVAPAHHRRGIGSALLADLIGRARAVGHHTIIAAIDAEQPASIAVHEKHGFARLAEFHEVGFKFGRWLHVHYMQFML